MTLEFRTNLWLATDQHNPHAILAYGLVMGCVWAIGWSVSTRVVVRVLVITAAWLLALAAGVGVPGHPVIGAGYVLPGAGWFGVAFALAFPSVALCVASWIPTRRALRIPATQTLRE